MQNNIEKVDRSDSADTSFTITLNNINYTIFLNKKTDFYYLKIQKKSFSSKFKK